MVVPTRPCQESVGACLLACLARGLALTNKPVLDCTLHVHPRLQRRRTHGEDSHTPSRHCLPVIGVTSLRVSRLSKCLLATTDDDVLSAVIGPTRARSSSPELSRA